MDLVLRNYNGIEIPQRPDGYINATKMCQAGGKHWSHFKTLKHTEEYIGALESTLGIPRVDIMFQSDGGNGERHTWIHPRLASRLAQWISPEFAVLVDGWVIEMMEGRQPSMTYRDETLLNELQALVVISRNTLESVSSMDNVMKNEVIPRIGALEDGQIKLSQELANVKNEFCRRKDPSARNQRIYMQVIWQFFNGCCPIYSNIRILETPQHRIYVNGQPKGQWEHWYSNSQNKLNECWLVSVEANRDLKNSEFKKRHQGAFDYFHRKVEEAIGTQLRLIG